MQKIHILYFLFIFLKWRVHVEFVKKVLDLIDVRPSVNKEVFEHLFLLLAVTYFSVFLQTFAGQLDETVKQGQLRGRQTASGMLSCCLFPYASGNWGLGTSSFLKEAVVLLITIPSAISSTWHIVGAQCLLNKYIHSLPRILFKDPREGLEKVRKLSILNFCTGPF